MAVVALKANAITNADASPRVLNSRLIAQGDLREHVSTIEVTNGDSIGSTFRMHRVKSSDRVSALKLYCDAITSAAADFGLYRTAADGGAVVDADFFASAQSIASAIMTGTEIQHESGVIDISEIEQPIWQLLGLSADPMIDYDLAATLTAAATATGTLTTKLQLVNMA